MLKHKNLWVADYKKEFGLIYGLLKRCPERFYVFYKESFADFSGKVRYDIYLLKISSQMIPYLEQQLQLKRISLEEDEKKMLFALKEAMRIKDENITFDDYIDNWVRKLMR